MRYLLLLLILLPWNAGGIPKEEIIMASLLLNEGQEQVREDLIVLKENGTFQQTKTVWAYLLEPPRWYLLLPGDRPFSRLIVLHEFWHYLQGDRESLFPLEIEADLYAFEGAEEEECFIFLCLFRPPYLRHLKIPPPTHVLESDLIGPIQTHE